MESNERGTCSHDLKTYNYLKAYSEKSELCKKLYSFSCTSGLWQQKVKRSLDKDASQTQKEGCKVGFAKMQR